MTNQGIPRIHSLPAAELEGVGESVKVFLHDTDPNLGPVQRSSHEMVRDVVDDLFDREGIAEDRDLKVLCVLAARIAVAKMATSPGFNIELGGTWTKNNPREIIRVTLRPDETPVRDAPVESYPRD